MTYVARRLWEACLISAILYYLEAMVFTKRTIAELESIQCMVGWFILQVPQSTSIVLVWFDAGLMPIEHRIQCREAVLILKISKTKNNDMLIYVLRFLLKSPGDPWVKSWMNIQNDIGVIENYERKQALVKAMSERAVKFVIRVLRTHSSMDTLPLPLSWFKYSPM